MKIRSLFITAIILASSTAANSADVQIGEEAHKNGMNIAAVYIQPVMMEPDHGASYKEANIHLEADIHATENNPNGFEKDSWIPYLTVGYQIQQVGTSWSTKGSLMPMVASDGPHYGDNVKLNGPGKYELKFLLASPAKSHFMRHIDKETGVAEWWDDFELNYEFNWIGSAGKKGGY